MIVYVIAGLLVVHGLIHAIGLAATFGGVEVEGFAGTPTLGVGSALQAFAALWGVALVGMLVAAAGVLLTQGWWRPVAVVAAAVSMVAIVVWWNDAKFGALANGLVLAAVLAAPRLPDVAN